jgi:hypothetical protein
VFTPRKLRAGGVHHPNFPFDDIDKALDESTRRGVRFERHDGIEPDEKAIAPGRALTSPGSRIPPGTFSLS